MPEQTTNLTAHLRLHNLQRWFVTRTIWLPRAHPSVRVSPLSGLWALVCTKLKSPLAPSGKMHTNKRRRLTNLTSVLHAYLAHHFFLPSYWTGDLCATAFPAHLNLIQDHRSPTATFSEWKIDTATAHKSTLQPTPMLQKGTFLNGSFLDFLCRGDNSLNITFNGTHLPGSPLGWE
jgi:hypothetical protein